MRLLKRVTLAVVIVLVALAVVLTVFDIRLGDGDGRILQPSPQMSP